MTIDQFVAKRINLVSMVIFVCLLAGSIIMYTIQSETDRRWLEYTQQLQAEHVAELEQVRTEMQTDLDTARVVRFGHGYWRGFYDFCVAMTGQNLGCLQSARVGHEDGIHLTEPPIMWNWQIVQGGGENSG